MPLIVRRSVCPVEWLEPVRFRPQDIVLPIKEGVEVPPLVPCGRVRQWTASKIVDVPQFRDETVDAETLVPRARVHQWTAEQTVGCTSISGRDRRGQSRVNE